MADNEGGLPLWAIKKMIQANGQREAALDTKIVVLNAAIGNLQQLPVTLLKQTSQYIEKGVRA
jgi:hypothetical protein